MPQLDKLTFFNQLFWSFSVYFCLYYILSAHVCPAIGRVLKVRSRLVSLQAAGSEKSGEVAPLSKVVLPYKGSSLKEVASLTVSASKLAVSKNI